MEIETSCKLILIHSKTKKFLILKLATEFEWDIVGGHVENGETHLETVFREAEEEIKIPKEKIVLFKDVKENALTDFFEYVSPVSGNTRRLIVFIGETNQEPISSHEHCGFAWCSYEESLQYLKFENIQNCLKKLYSQIPAKNNK
jgi:8-oxo-dGTP pyrophosphatase MutT (NUDIX family)